MSNMVSGNKPPRAIHICTMYICSNSRFIAHAHLRHPVAECDGGSDKSFKICCKTFAKNGKVGNL